MADILKLKKKAADLEAKKQLDKALDVYRDIVAAYEAGDEDPIDIPLYNRVGDMLQKAGNLPEAVSVWEKAVDHYTDGGFFNPAIALCNKILRQSPGRTVIYYKLGKIHAEKGFKGDARQNFLEYASRQQKAGNLDEAFRALKEFADLVPDQHDVRLMLADQLVRAEKKDEAIAQLQLGYGQAMADGDTKVANQIADKMREIDPSVEPKADGGASASGGGGLVFLDIDGSAAPAKPAKRTPRASEIKRVTKAVEGLELLEPPPLPAEEVPRPAPAARASVAKPAPAPPLARPTPAPPVEELLIEPTNVGADAPSPPRGSIAGLEITNLGDEAPPPADALPLLEVPDAAEAPPTGSAKPEPEPPQVADLPVLDLEPDPAVDLPLIEPEVSVGGGVELITDESTAFGSLPDFEPSIPEDVPKFDTSPVEEAVVDEASVADGADLVDLPLLDAEEPLPMSTALSVDDLRVRVEASPDDWGLRRQLAEAMLEQGDRDAAMRELEAAMAGYEHAGDLDTAGSIAEEVVRLAPGSIRHHQKRVEFAFRANDRARLAEAYIELADALLADGQAQKARAVYQRVLDITPDDLRAQAAIESIPEESAAPPPAPRRSSTAAPPKAAPKAPKAPAAPAAPAPKKDGDDAYVSLGDWLREDDEPKSLRMVVEEQEPTGDEQADFADMLRKFKQGVSDNVDDEDHEAHYDLGVAYKEMGLLDEAIAEFQKALRGTKDRVRTFEALGHCFVEKGQLPVASTILQRALAEPAVRDEALVGVLYLLGAIAEELQQFADAKRYYERVFAVDIQFRDVGDRLNAVEQRL